MDLEQSQPEKVIFRFYYVSEGNQQTDKTSFKMVRMTGILWLAVRSDTVTYQDGVRRPDM